MKKIFLIFIVFLFNNTHAEENFKTLTAVSKSSPPMFYNENGTVTGIDVEVIQFVAKKLGYKVEFIDEPWEKALIDTKQGKFDFIFEADINEERKNFFYFTRPTMQLKMAFYKSKNLNFFYSSLDSFSKYIVGIGNGFVFENRLQTYIDRKIYQIYNISGNDTDIQGLLKAAFKQVDFYICPSLTGQFIINKKRKIFPELLSLDYIEPESLEGSWPRLAFSKARENSLQLSQNFDKELMKFLSTPDFNKIVRKYVKTIEVSD